MNNIHTLKQELIHDALDTCLNDSAYLVSILKCYFDSQSEEDILRMHQDAFEQESTGTNICVEIQDGCVQRIYGGELPDSVEINFIVRDLDAIKEGYIDPLPRNFQADITYW